MYRPCEAFHKWQFVVLRTRYAYAVGLSGHMELSALELGEVLEEDGNKGSDVLRCFLRGALQLPSTIRNWMLRGCLIGPYVPRTRRIPRRRSRHRQAGR